MFKYFYLEFIRTGDPWRLDNVRVAASLPGQIQPRLLSVHEHHVPVLDAWMTTSLKSCQFCLKINNRSTKV